jgi:hypothetical protein
VVKAGKKDTVASLAKKYGVSASRWPTGTSYQRKCRFQTGSKSHALSARASQINRPQSARANTQSRGSKATAGRQKNPSPKKKTAPANRC